MIFFFDIDGVFTSHRANVGHLNIGGKMSHFDQYTVNMINTLGRAANAQCVIISSWRFAEKDVPVEMKRQGVKIPIHEDWCMQRHPNSQIDDKDRGYLIREWCKKHHVSTKDIVIFDDENCGYDKELAPRFIKSNIHDGFSFKNFDDACHMLGITFSDCRKAQNQLIKERAPGRHL